MTRSVRGLTAAAVVSVCVCFAARGGAPLITDDPFTPPGGGWEINLAFTMAQTRSQRVYESPQLDLNYGATDHLQLNAILPYTIVDAPDAGPVGGIGNTVLGAKWRFLDEEAAGFAMSAYPKMVFNTPGLQSVGRGLVDAGTAVILPLQIAKTFGRIDVYGDVGYQFVQHGEDVIFFGAAGGWHASDRLLLLSELHFNVDADLRRPSPIVQLGTAYTVNEHLNLLLAAGRSLRGGDDDPQLLVYFAIQLEY